MNFSFCSRLLVYDCATFKMRHKRQLQAPCLGWVDTITFCLESYYLLQDVKPSVNSMAYTLYWQLQCGWRCLKSEAIPVI